MAEQFLSNADHHGMWENTYKCSRYATELLLLKAEQYAANRTQCRGATFRRTAWGQNGLSVYVTSSQ